VKAQSGQTSARKAPFFSGRIFVFATGKIRLTQVDATAVAACPINGIYGANPPEPLEGEKAKATKRAKEAIRVGRDATIAAGGAPRLGKWIPMNGSKG